MIEQHIAAWRARQGRGRIEMEELEQRLRAQARSLEAGGLSGEEAFVIALKREAAADPGSLAYARTLLGAPGSASGPAASPPRMGRDLPVAIGLALAAAALIKLPELFGLQLHESAAAASFYARNLGLFVLPLLAAWFAWQRALGRRDRLWLALPFVAALVLVNAMPFAPEGQTATLVALHLPIALWLAVGFAHAGGNWRDHEARMDFVRFTGEWFVHYALIALGGGVLMACTLFIFNAIGVSPEQFVTSWMLPCGVVGAVIIAAWLVPASGGMARNLAPLLARVFTPLFTLLLLAYLVTMAATGSGIRLDREVLIGFDLLLAVILGLVIYAISSRDPAAPPGLFDRLQFALVLCAVLVDGIALWAIAGRIGEFGFSANKLTALGENLVLLVNLGVTAVHYARFLAGRTPFATLERWQTACLPVYAAWAWLVVAVFPPVFGYQ